VTAGVVVRRSSEPRRGRPKPIYATASAIEAAERAGVAGCVEERVREGILGGRKRRGAAPGLPPLDDGAYVALDDGSGAVAVLRRVPRRLRPQRRAWLVVAVIPRHRLPRGFSLGPLPGTAQEAANARETRTSVRSGPAAVSNAAGAEIASCGLAGEDARWPS
jgi:hypothetical protein